MNTSPNNRLPSDAEAHAGHGPGEETLRLIAMLPAPEGLESRVKAGLATAPQAGRILMWRGPLRPAGGWMYSSFARGAAAAAIVCIVAGGGWQIYSRVQPPAPARVLVTPAPITQPGRGFSQSNAPHVPDTIVGPELKHPMAPVSDLNAVEKVPAQAKAAPGCPCLKEEKSTFPCCCCPAAVARGKLCGVYASLAMARKSIPRIASTTAPQNAGTIP